MTTGSRDQDIKHGRGIKNGQLNGLATFLDKKNVTENCNGQVFSGLNGR
jgi:hypothetical protein